MRADRAPMISGSDEDFFAVVVNSSLRMEFSANMTAVAVLILDLDLVREPSVATRINSLSGFELLVFIDILEVFVLSPRILSLTSGFVVVVKLDLGIFSISAVSLFLFFMSD